MQPPRQQPTPPRSRARDDEVRRVSRVTRTIAALAAAGVAVGSAFAASSHRTAASFDPAAGSSATGGSGAVADRQGTSFAAPASVPVIPSAPPVASSGAS